MTKRILGTLSALMVLLLVVPLSAPAAVIEGDSSGIFQRWTDEIRMPTPSVVSVRPGAPGECGYEFGLDSTNPACVFLPDTIVITKSHWINRWTFYHEMGHVFDAEVLTEAERARFVDLVGFPGRPWDFAEPGVDIHETAPREFFADAYAECAFTGTKPTKEVLSRILPMEFGPAWVEGATRWERICRLISAA